MLNEKRTRQWVEKHTSINVNSVYNAAKWIVENNPHCKESIFSLIDQIHDSIDKLLDKAIDSWDYCSTSTYDYTVEFQPEDIKYATVEVRVDPSVGTNRFYVSTEDYFQQVKEKKF